jgi:hypothetical protein
MKKITLFTLVLLLTFTISTEDCFSHGKTVVKNSCTWGWQFRAKAKVNKLLAVKVRNSFGCGDLDDAYAYKSFNCVWQKAYASLGNSWTKGAVTKTPWKCGRGFIKSDLYYDLTNSETKEREPSSYEYGDFNFNGVKFHENQVIIPNLNAELYVKGVNVTSSIEIVVWKPKHDFINNIEDTIVSEDKYLWYGKVELLNGKLIFSGDISRESINLKKDFDNDDAYQAIFNDITIVIDLDDNVNGIEDEIIVSVMSDGGFDEKSVITSVLEKSSNDFSVYPNPSSGLITIEFDSNESKNQSGVINLYNDGGQFVKQIYEGDLNGFNSNFSLFDQNFSSGIYFVSMETADGKVYLQKITYQK